MTTGPRCTHTVPESLCGNLRPLPRCGLPLDGAGGPHHGDCRAVVRLPEGKATFKWKPSRMARINVERPEIVLPRRVDRIVEKVKCTCPIPNVKDHQHLAGCPRRALFYR